MSGEKIKVALMSYAMDNRPAKGTALYARKLIENLLDDERFEFYLIHFEKVDDPLYAQANEILIPKVPFPFGSRFISLMIFFWKQRSDKFEIIHWFQPRVYPFFWLAPAKKIVVTMHGAGDITAPGKMTFSRKIFNLVLKRFNSRIDMIIAGSQFGREEIIQYYDAHPLKISVTYYGGGEEYQALDKSEARRLAEEKYKLLNPFILNVSRLQPHKNIKRIIEAYNLLRQLHEHSEKLVIVGWPSQGAKEIYEMALRSPYQNDITFIKFVESSDLNSVYSASEVFVFPSLNEGFGLPVVEAMASGVPVITSNTTSLPEVGGDAAILINPESVEEIAEAMHQVLSNPSLSSQMVAKGLAWSQNFTWEKTAQATKNIYQDLLK